MQIEIGPYKNYIGPYQIAEKILFWMDKEDDRVSYFGEWLSKTWIQSVCTWVDSRRKRNIQINIEPFDVWSMDHTLAMIILPMLKMLKEKKQGAPFVDDEDVPENLRSIAASPKENEWDTDDLFFARWDWVLDEMIWAFEQTLDEEVHQKFSHGTFDLSVSDEGILESGPNHTWIFDDAAYKVHMDRMKNGFILFGKYYQNLWA